MDNKRGQEMSTTAIILIILGVIVLVVLILGFTIGWNKLFPWLSSNNVGSIVSSCDVACSTGDKFGFCSTTRELNDGTSKITSDCATFSVFSEYTQYGINKCNTIKCDFTCSDIKIKGISAEEKESCLENEEDISSLAKTTRACCVAK